MTGTAVRSAWMNCCSLPSSLARVRIDAAAGALVKVIASRSPRSTAPIILSMRATSGCMCQRYTGIGTTSAPAARSTVQKSGSGSHSLVAPCNWTAIRTPSTPSSSSRSRTSEEDSLSGDHSSRSPAARIAPLAFGPRAISRLSDSARRTASALPHPSAASTHPRKPIPVVATITSGGWAMSSSVTRSSSVSSTSGRMRMVGACITSAPRRSSSTANSSARRAAVIPIVKPASGNGSGSGEVAPAGSAPAGVMVFTPGRTPRRCG